MIVYLVKCIVTGKVYVGKTIHTLEKRWLRHLYDAGRGLRTQFANALRKHGRDGFEVTLLQKCSSVEELKCAEIAWIEKLDSFKSGYNCTRGGDGIAGFKHSLATREKMSRSQKGRIVSASARQKLSKAFKGRKRSKDAVRKQFETRAGYKHTAETKHKIGDGNFKYANIGPVLQLTKDGNVLQSFVTIGEAAIAISGKSCHIWNVISGSRHTHKGFKWRLSNSLESSST